MIVLIAGLVVLGILVWLAARCAAAVIRAVIRIAEGLTPAWWWFSGHHLRGRTITNAGWLEHGSKALTPNGRASRWAHKPRLERAAWRTGGTVLVLAVVYGLIADTGPVLAALAVFAAAGAAWASWCGWRGAQQWRHTRQWVRPLHLALAPLLGHPLAVKPRSWLEVPRDYAGREGAKVTVHLPKGFAAVGDTPKSAITGIVSAKLALERPDASWHLAGHDPHVIYRVQVPPPDKVALADVRELLAAAADTAPLLGLGRGRKPVHADLDGDSPHLLVSAGSGGGKSVTTRTLVAQILAKGGVALILDVKRLSQAWARGLPNVRYCRDIAEIHEACLWLGGELDQRNKLADDGADIDGNTDGVDVGPRIVVLAEEMNATAGRLATYWRQIKDKDDPSVSPAVDALADTLFMGRQVKVNVLAVAQMLTARTIGGPEARENMGVRILARYTLNNWRVLVPEIWPAPKASKHRGRVQVCVAGTAKETQIAFLTPAEARELATSGIVSRFPDAAAPTLAAKLPANVTRLRLAPEPIGLRQAVAEGVVPIGLEAARKARTRDPEFPSPRGTGQGGEHLFDRDELAVWARNRPRAAGE